MTDPLTLAAAIMAPLLALDPWLLLAMAAMMALAGFVKGAVGFALPMIAVSGLGSLLSAQETIAYLILPTLLSNLWQGFRQGILAAWRTLGAHWRLNLVFAIVAVPVAQAVPAIPSAALFAGLGTMVTLAAAVQLAGWRPSVGRGRRERAAAEIGAGAVAGVTGGMAGVWGPPVVLYLAAIGTEKREQVRAAGLTFLLGSVILVAAHSASGLLDARTAPVSAALCLPVMAGMALGLWAQDRMDQAVFRRATLVVLCLAGLNLLRRAVF